MVNPARGLLNREKKTKRENPAAHPPPRCSDIYVMFVETSHRVDWAPTGIIADRARGQFNRESLSPFAPI